MKKIAFQKLPGGYFKPFSVEDQEAASHYKDYQIVQADVRGVKKPRSLLQLKLYFQCCEKVADNNTDPYWQTKESVDFQCRVACDFRDKSMISVRPDGTVQFHYKSLSYANCDHVDATRYMTDAFDVMAHKLNITTETLLQNAEG